jgi:hypothetical protein
VAGGIAAAEADARTVAEIAAVTADAAATADAGASNVGQVAVAISKVVGIMVTAIPDILAGRN